MLLPRQGKILPACVGSFLLSLVFEVTQYIRMLGTSDLTDLLTNTLGGIIGAGMFCLCQRIWSEKAGCFLSMLCIPATLAFCFVSFFII